MISRQWRALAHPDRAQEYIRHLRTETFPALRKIPGFVDASILSRRVAGGVEFLITTTWESIDAIARFAGSDPEAAVVPAKAADMMIEYDRRVRHFEVIESHRPLRAAGAAGVTLSVLANIDVDDLARATEFYCSALDLRVGRRLGSGVVELLGGSAPIYLLQKRAGTSATPAASACRDYDRHWTPVHLDFVVPDIGRALARAQSAGARLEGEPRTCEWGHIAAMADPFGHGFCLIEFLGRGYDEIAT